MIVNINIIDNNSNTVIFKNVLMSYNTIVASDNATDIEIHQALSYFNTINNHVLDNKQDAIFNTNNRVIEFLESHGFKEHPRFSVHVTYCHEYYYNLQFLRNDDVTYLNQRIKKRCDDWDIIYRDDYRHNEQMNLIGAVTRFHYYLISNNLKYLITLSFDSHGSSHIELSSNLPLRGLTKFECNSLLDKMKYLCAINGQSSDGVEKSLIKLIKHPIKLRIL